MKQKLLRSIRNSLAMLVLSMLLCTVAFAQKNVSGKVTTATGGQPISGATVSVKGTTVASSTGTDGTFSILVPNDKSTLVVSFIGYDVIEVPVAGKTDFAIALKERTSTLNEVVVTGYTSQKKKDITGSVSVVDVKAMKQAPVGTGEEALQGRASGVTIITSGQPGAASDIRIRGITGFGNNNPLILVDGVRGSIHDLNPNDIESVQVLKDASAAIYGVAGSNGVIIVTTRKGRGKTRVSYDGYYGQKTRGPGYEMANTAEEGQAIWTQQKNSGVAVPTDKQFGTGPEPVIPDYITPAAGFEGNPLADPATYDINTNQITRANPTGTNWYNEITRNAPTQSHTVSVSSGSEKNSFFLSLGYLDEQGIAQFQYLKRYSVRVNTLFNIKKNVRIGENAYVFYRQNPTFGNQSEGSPFTTAFREASIIPVYDIMGNFAGTKSQGLGNARNPYADIYRTKDNKGYVWNIMGNVYGEVDFLKHFTFRSSFGGAVINDYNYAFNYVGYENAEGNTGANSFGENASYSSNYTFTNTLTYTNIFGNHTLTALLGTEAVSVYGRYMSAGRSNYFSENPNYWTLNTGSPSGQSNSGGAYQNSLWSQFAKVEYGFKGKYLVNASIRRDGASVFAEDARWGYFPGVAVAWRISEEDFLKGTTWINDLKLRASWATLGSTSNVNSTNPYNLYGQRAGKSYYDISGTSTGPAGGFYRSNLGNAETSWEEDIISNVGFDATLFNNKFDITLDWYKKKVSGLLFTASGLGADPIFVGDADLPKVNIGDMQNTGLDASLTYHGTSGRDFKFDLTATITTYDNKIVDVPGLPYFNGDQIRNVIVQRYEEGHPVGAFYGYKVLGLFKDADDVAKSASQQGDASPGVFKYDDLNGDGKIDADDRQYIGDPNPNFTYGLNIALSYKNFDLSAFFFGSQGNDIFNQTKYFTDFPDFFKGGIRREAAINSWRPDNTGATIPKLRTVGGFSTDGVTNSYFITDGSYMRCKQLQIGYSLPEKTLSKYGIDRLRIYVQGANLFTLTSYDGLDPELQSNDISRTTGFGIDQGNYPHTPAYLFGVNLSF